MGGQIGGAQKAETASFLAFGVSFKVASMRQFVKSRRPWFSMLKDHDWDGMALALTRPGIQQSLQKSDTYGSTPLISAVLAGAPPSIVKSLFAAQVDPLAI